MGEHTAISWCDHTINWWIGCTKVSPACDGCYAEAMMDHRYGRVTWGRPGQRATYSRTAPTTWNEPLRWARKAEVAGTRPFVFSSSLSDIFDNQVPAEWRRDAFEIMRRTPRLVYLLLTKRPQLIVDLSREAGGLPPNAAIGTTAEDDKRFDMNVSSLRKAKRLLDPLFAFVSCEPMLGPIYSPIHDLDWIITGGETDQGGHRARPWHPDWVRTLRDQAARAGIPFHHKQNGEWLPGEVYSRGNHGGFCRHIDGTENTHKSMPDHWWSGGAFGGVISTRVGKTLAGRLLDGVLHDARPEVR